MVKIMNTIDRMKEISHRLQEASKAYYQEDREIMSNFEYDNLYEELEKLEAETGIQLAGSPTSQVGYTVVEGLEKVTHEVPLLSLDKTKDVDKLESFLGLHTGLLSWKLDGLTVVLRYENGTLKQAVTRGNGTIGEDVTHNARVFANIPLRIPCDDQLLIRGEAVITYDDFDAINTDNVYKNPRNLCSGTVRQLDSEATAGRRVRYYAFAILKEMGQSDQEDSDQHKSDHLKSDQLKSNQLKSNQLKSDQLKRLADMGFDVVEHILVSDSSNSNKESSHDKKTYSVEDAISYFRQKLPDMGIPSDGLVLTYDDIAYSTSLGHTSKFPKDALAFKWKDELAETKLRYIEWNTSRTGLINPIAVFDHVDLEGTLVNKAGLHNISIIRQLELGEGDTITVYKANMIIPQVAENLTRSNSIHFPDKCPVCESHTEILKQREGEFLYCPNFSCRARLIGSLVHFCSRDAMNIEGLSEQTLEKWVECGFVSDYTNIYELGRFEDEIIQMEGFGRKSYDNLMSAIERSKDVKLANFIYALGIKHVGLSNAKLLANHFGSLEAIIEKSRKDSFLSELTDIKGFGEAIATSLVNFFAERENIDRLEKAMKLLKIKSITETESIQMQFPLHGLTFVITGSVEQFPNRRAMQNYIEERGGKCTGSVSANTSYLINNDNTSTSAKNKKAQSLDIPILTEGMFMERWG